MRRALFLLCLAAGILSACRSESRYRVLTGANHTTYRIQYQYDRTLDREIEAAFRRYYHSINAFDSLSVISRINRNESTETDSLFRHVFRTAMALSAQTDGLFDVTCAPLINLWGFGFQQPGRVTPQAVDSIRAFVGFRKVRLTGNRLVKDDPRVLLNFSALGDGTICDLLGGLFDAKGISNYLIEVGGEVLAKGKNPHGRNWRVGIVKPRDDLSGAADGELEQIVQLPERLGLATSGNYRNFYIKDGKKYAHTINPVTGYPAEQDILSATIIAEECILADACATAFMVLGSDKARALQRNYPGIDYFIIYTDSLGKYRTEYSAGMKKYLYKPE